MSLEAIEHEIGARIRAGDLAGAAAAAAACRRAFPRESAGWHLGSMVALLEGQASSALALSDEWIAAHPHDVQCQLQRAECLLALGQREAALAAAEHAREAANGLAPALEAIAEFLVHSGAFERAVQVYDQLLGAFPRNASWLAGRAELRRFLGHFALAADDYRAVLAASPGDADALKSLALLQRQTPACNLIAEMKAAMAQAPQTSSEAATLHFALAKTYEDLGEYETSWSHLSAGNRLERARTAYEPALDRAAFDLLIAGFHDPNPESTGSSDEAPVFIVGLPRTGTTLVDRILGSHSALHSAGELSALSEALSIAAQQVAATGKEGWLEFAARLPRLDYGIVSKEYLSRAKIRRGDKPWFTDKQPTNFMYCGPILRALPRARIIHLTRHPLAACYAIYKTRFRGTYPFSYDLSELGDFYVSYRRLMAHWHRVLPGRIYDVAYEDVVSKLEPTTRALLEWLGLPFEEECLQFHRNPAPTTTASAVQVRQPLYTGSLDQWKHFSRELAPLAARLTAAGIPIE